MAVNILHFILFLTSCSHSFFKFIPARCIDERSICVNFFVVGLKQVGDLKKGLNPLSINNFVFEGRYLQTILKAALITAILMLTVRTSHSYSISNQPAYGWISTSLLNVSNTKLVISQHMDGYPQVCLMFQIMQEGIAIGRTFALFKNYNIDGNKEMIAIGMMNIVGSCTSCYITTGTQSISSQHLTHIISSQVLVKLEIGNFYY